ncbi:hypothetical protein [Streptomyces sp. NPDC056683]
MIPDTARHPSDPVRRPHDTPLTPFPHPARTGHRALVVDITLHRHEHR